MTSSEAFVLGILANAAANGVTVQVERSEHVVPLTGKTLQTRTITWLERDPVNMPPGLYSCTLTVTALSEDK